MIIIALVYGATFTSCSKESDNDILLNLKGSTWEAKITSEGYDAEGKMLGTSPALLSLHFVDGSLCTIRSGRLDGTYSANLAEYTWRYATNADSKWGQFYLYSKHEYPFDCTGNIENGKLYLVFYSGSSLQQSYCFERKK